MIVGLSGATCSGKTTIATLLKRLFPRATVINQDTYYWKEDSNRHIRHEKSGFINWEVMSAFDMDRLRRDVTEFRFPDSGAVTTVRSTKSSPWKREDMFFSDCCASKNEKIEFRPEFLSATQAVREKSDFLIVEGILVLNDARIRKLCDIQVFIELDRSTCWSRRQFRTYDPEDQIGYFDNLAWPYYLDNLSQLKSASSDVVYMDGKQDIKSNFASIFNRILDKCQEVSS